MHRENFVAVVLICALLPIAPATAAPAAADGDRVSLPAERAQEAVRSPWDARRAARKAARDGARGPAPAPAISKGLAPDCAWSEAFRSGGMDSDVWAQVVFDDGSGPATYFAGEFVTAGGVVVNYVAKWDGTTWSSLGVGMDDYVFALAVYDDGGGDALYAGGQFTTAGGIPATGIAKWNGTSWSAVGGGVDDTVGIFAVYDDGGGDDLYAGGIFSTAGGGAANNIARWDGASWTTLDAGTAGPVFSMTVHDDGGGEDLYVGGSFALAGATSAANVARWDGTTWSALGTGVAGDVWDLESHDDDGLGADLYAAGDFFTAGGAGVLFLARWDGATWTDLDGGFDAPVWAIASYDDGGGAKLYAAGDFVLAGTGPAVAYGIARWDGASWTSVGAGIDEVLSYTYANTLDVIDGDLSLGGYFFVIDDVAALMAATWDGIQWMGVGLSGPDVQGLDGTVYTSIVFDDGSGPALFVGGEITGGNGVPTSAVAKWDGTSWSSVGGGMRCDPFGGCTLPLVETLEIHDDGSGRALYAGGVFDFAGLATARNIAKWDGTSWSALGSGTDDIVEGLASFDDGGGAALYAGGEFLDAGGVAVSRIARWDGTAWSDVGGGVDLDIETLTVFDDGGGEDLYAGGEFLNAGGVPANYVARWDGATWSALGAGTDGEVETLYVYDDGGGDDLYAGGAFGVAGGITARSVARWDGTTWSDLDGGMGPLFGFRSVDALAAFDDGNGTDLYAGGFFTSAGSAAALNIARWDGTAWSALDLGTDGEVETLTVFNLDQPVLYAGGPFQLAGSLPSAFVGAWECPAAEFAIDDVSLVEGDRNTTTDFVFTISRSHNATDASVDVNTSSGTALVSFDYLALPLQTLDFPLGGALDQQVTVTVVGDRREEQDETFFVDLSDLFGGTLVDDQGRGVILDDDQVPLFADGFESGDTSAWTLTTPPL